MEKEQKVNFSFEEKRDFTEVGVAEIKKLRKSKIPALILKENGRFFVTTMSADAVPVLNDEDEVKHMCSSIGQDCCRRLSAASDENGGCKKVRDRARCIERYPWITKGYETFNTRHDYFVVLQCEHYEPCPPPKYYTAAEINRRRLALALFVYPDMEI